MEIEQLYFERDVLVNSLQKMADCSKSDETQFRCRIKELNSIKKDFLKVQIKIEKHLVKNNIFSKDDQLDVRNSFDEIYYQVQAAADTYKISQRRYSQPSNNNGASASHCHRGGLNLPPLPLPSFSGQPTEWAAYFELFKALVHDNDDLMDVQKFRYLLLTLKDEPYNLIKSLPITDANYNNAVTILSNRYENKRVIATKHLDTIFDLEPLTDKNTYSGLRKLLNVFQENLTALDALKLPTSEWSFILLNILLRKMSPNIRRRFELSLSSPTEIPDCGELIQFLNRELAASEVMSCTAGGGSAEPAAAAAPARRAPPRYLFARTQSDNQNSFTRTRTFSNVSTMQNEPRMVRFNVESSTNEPTVSKVCIYCKSATHILNKCEGFRAQSIIDRKRFINEYNVCINCLHVGHDVKNCISRFSCKVCSQRHHSSLHEAELSESSPMLRANSYPVPPSASSVAAPTVTHCGAGARARSSVLLTTAIVDVRSAAPAPAPRAPTAVRVLVDQGSQATLITESCVQRLNLRRFHAASDLTVTGIGDKNEKSRGYVLVEVTPHGQSAPKLVVEAHILPKLTSYVPNINFSIEKLPHLQNLTLADSELRSSRPVELLLGSDYTGSILLQDNVVGPPGTPVAMNSIFGYLLNGRLPASDVKFQLHAYFNTHDNDIQLQKFWELESLPEVKPLTSDEALCEDMFVQTHYRDENGKYIVALPFKPDAPPLGESRDIALSRLGKLEQRLERNPDLKAEYIKCLQEYIDLGHMELVDESSAAASKPYYIPHHCVLKASSSTTKVRVVFDASCKSTSGRSLNDNLLIGPKLHQDIVQVLLKFRLHEVVFTADIKMMYRFISLRPEDRDNQRILWRSNPDVPVQEFRLCTVTFGVASSPFLALRTLRQLAIDESASFPKASKILLNDVFVDDVISGTSSLEEAKLLQQELIALCKAGTFDLRKWTSNCPELMSSVTSNNTTSNEALAISNLDGDTSVKVLGLKWDPKSDTFSYEVKPSPASCTKRIILSEISKIFDPLGFLSPITLFAKHLIQLLWISGAAWDEVPPKSISEAWYHFISELPLLESIMIPRHAFPQSKDLQIHGFSDASEKAFSAAVYIRVTDKQDNIRVHLVLAKTKVAPLKRISLPRLELCGAVLLSKLIETVLNAYSEVMSIANVYAWSDSSITLAWVRSSSYQWRTFVSNRITEVTSRIPADRWRHVRSADNPADPASRGVLPSELDRDLWFHGPSWLTRPETEWPISMIDFVTDEEKRNEVLVSTIDTTNSTDTEFISRFSSLPKLLRVVSYMFRFINTCRKIKTPDKHITVQENKFALSRLISLVQSEQFSDDLSKLKLNKNCSDRLQKLKPFVDNSGLLRVGGRIERAFTSYNAKHQILLPKSHHLTRLIIDHHHRLNLHVGPQTLQFILSHTYWILSARDAVRMRTRRCIQCFRAKPRAAPQPQMAALPAARVRSFRPFLHVGVDFAGYFQLKSSNLRNAKTFKAYVSVMICMSTKACHLELVPTLSTESFLNALRRFVARRGLCSDIYSDCGRNFVGCDRYLKELFDFLKTEENQLDLNKGLMDSGITWHFNVPYASHFAGYWEACVKSFKTHLYRVIGSLILTYDEFNTLLCQIESVLNSRPLCVLSNDPCDPLPLTPAHFLVGEPLTSLPDYDYSDEKPSRLQRWQVIQQAVSHFWKRWSSEYLSQLQQRGRWFRDEGASPLAEGSVVVVRDDALPPLQWRLARVHALHPGADGITRVVTLRMGNTYTKRPVVKVCPLPID